MRKIVAGMFVSLDGVVEAPERWTFDYFTDVINGFGKADAADSKTYPGREYRSKEHRGHGRHGEQALFALPNQQG